MKICAVEHLLPEVVQTIVSLIGMASTMKLVDELGGTTFPVALRRSRLGEIRYEALAEVIGAEAADVLTKHFGGDMLYIPLCKTALRELMYREIRAEFDRITREHSAIYAVVALVTKYRLSDRQIWRILKKNDVEAHAGNQAALF